MFWKLRKYKRNNKMAMNVFKASRLVLIAFAVSYLLSMVVTNVTRTLKYEIGYVSLKYGDKVLLSTSF